jgi:hypothetical protein
MSWTYQAPVADMRFVIEQESGHGAPVLNRHAFAFQLKRLTSSPSPARASDSRYTHPARRHKTAA